MVTGLKMLKPIAFVGSLAVLALVMGSGERAGRHACPGDLALETSKEIIKGRPGVVDMVWSDFELTGCQVGVRGYADVRTAEGFDRKQFDIVMAFDPRARKWQQVSLDMPQ